MSGRVDGSSRVQNQKLRCRASLGEMSACHVPEEFISYFIMNSVRSRTIGTQPMPPSDMAILMFGNRIGTNDHSHSRAEASPHAGNITVRCSTGASADMVDCHSPVPVCRELT